MLDYKVRIVKFMVFQAILTHATTFAITTIPLLNCKRHRTNNCTKLY